MPGLPTSTPWGEILRITEGSLAPVAYLESLGNTCGRLGGCITLPVWQGLYDTICSDWDGITLQDMLTQQKTKRSKE